MKNRLISRVVIISMVVLLKTLSYGSDKTPRYIPPEGFVPDKETATKIAEAVAIPIYGKEQIAKEKPLTAELKGDIWRVTGTHRRSMSLREYGGEVIVEISKKDATIISIIHEK